MHHKRMLRFLSLAVLLGLTSPIWAADMGGSSSDERVRLYLGGSVGVSKMKNGMDAFPLGEKPDTNGTGLKAFLGIEMMPHSAIELFAVDFGKFNANNATLAYDDTWEAKGAGISYVGGASVNDYVSFHLKVGGFYWKVEDKGSVAGVAFSSEEDGTGLFFGIGTQFNFGRWIAMRIEWEQYGQMGDDRTTGSSNVQMVTASLLIRL